MSGPFRGCYLLLSRRTPQSSRTYIGFTVNPLRRIRQHNGELGSGAKKTKLGRPWTMVLVVHGFSTKVQALQFEWAWQHPEKSKAVREVAARLGARKMVGAKGKVRLLTEMLNLDPWRYFPLSLHVTSSDHLALLAGCTPLPSHMSRSVAPLEALKPLLMGAPDQDADEDAEDAGAASDEGSDAEGALHAAETPSPAPQAVAPAAQARLDAKVLCAVCQEAGMTTWLQCPACDSRCHTSCLARHFLQGTEGLPTQGTCPACDRLTTWAEALATGQNVPWAQNRRQKKQPSRGRKVRKKGAGSPRSSRSKSPAKTSPGKRSPAKSPNRASSPTKAAPAAPRPKAAPRKAPAKPAARKAPVGRKPRAKPGAAAASSTASQATACAAMAEPDAAQYPDSPSHGHQCEQAAAATQTGQAPVLDLCSSPEPAALPPAGVEACGSPLPLLARLQQPPLPRCSAAAQPASLHLGAQPCAEHAEGSPNPLAASWEPCAASVSTLKAAEPAAAAAAARAAPPALMHSCSPETDQQRRSVQRSLTNHMLSQRPSDAAAASSSAGSMSAGCSPQQGTKRTRRQTDQSIAPCSHYPAWQNPTTRLVHRSERRAAAQSAPHTEQPAQGISPVRRQLAQLLHAEDLSGSPSPAPAALKKRIQARTVCAEGAWPVLSLE